MRYAMPICFVAQRIETGVDVHIAAFAVVGQRYKNLTHRLLK
jgi:hypothetical protein